MGSCNSSQGEVVETCEYSDKTFRFHKMQEISWLAKNVLASQEELCPMEFVCQSVSSLQNNNTC